MGEFSIYEDIAKRTGGDIYIGVVGPVRSGKSTFIKRFMEAMVLPNIPDESARARAKDEMPQSAAGKTVMTTEPKFVPDEAVPISFAGGKTMRVKMVDCVGYLVPDALGVIEEGKARMVRTPWREEPMPFAEAAELGTHRVIHEHATIGMLVSTDGTVGEIPRENYVEAEERIVKELKALGKPFAMVLNSATPNAESSIELAYELEEKYGIPVALVSCLSLDEEDIRHILELVLHEFPIAELRVAFPTWIHALEPTHHVRVSLGESLGKSVSGMKKIGDINRSLEALEKNDYVSDLSVDRIDLGTGCAHVRVSLADGLFYEVMSELTGMDISDDRQLLQLLREFSAMKSKYDRVAEAFDDATEKGYGIVMPDIDELHLEEPEIIKQAGGYGVKLRASAQSIHMIRANIETEINPIVGSEQQSEELIRYMLHEFEEAPRKIWESNMFGKSLYELMNEGLHTKLSNIPEDSRLRLSETLEKIINEGSGGLICILL
ncbi:MAG: stage IV sporulation protein A [Clostridia bacterium]|nr:stage IV sporulation protein A [Clostridia bacterium]